MKFGVIDIGSNSVRLMVANEQRAFYKKVINTRLAEGMNAANELTQIAISRTVNAIKEFCDLAKNENCDEIFCFATAAVRRASNKQNFIASVKDVCGINVDVVSGEKEAQLGLLGVLGNSDGGIIDVGGASTEIAVIDKGKLIFSKSIDLGAVVIKDKCVQDYAFSCALIDEKIQEFGEIFNTKFYAIGGTATSVAAMLQQLKVYDPNKVDGYVVTLSKITELVDKLYSMSVEDRKKLSGLQPERAEVIAGGVLVIKKLMQKIGINEIIVSERDNQEGYLIEKLGRNE